MTIMELMVAMALSTIAFSLIWGTYSFYTGSIRNFSKRRDSYYDLSSTVSFISEELRRAQVVTLLTTDSCQYVTARGDTALFTFSDAQLHRKKSSTSELQPFKALDTLYFTLPEEYKKQGWNFITITGQESYNQKKSSFSRSLLVNVKEKEEFF